MFLQAIIGAGLETH
jgi:hypothetical protein